MADLFDEVEEQLRSQRYMAAAKRAAPWVIAALAAALIAALAYWGWDSYRTQVSNKASEQYVAGLQAYNAGRTTQAVQQWTEVSKSQSSAYKALALMQLGGVKVAENKPAEAVTLFDQAAGAAREPIIADAARLKSAFTVLDTAPYAEVEGRLTPLMEDGRPYRAQAREALAFAKLQKGDVKGARADFVIISAMLDAAEGARARAKAAIQLIDSGSAKAVPGVVKAALAAPPTPAPGIAPPADQPQPQAPGQQ